MNPDSETLVRFLDGAQLVTEHAAHPENPDDADEVLSALHHLTGTTEALHDQIVGCYGPLDPTGRCAICGRLVALGMWRGHKEGAGCLMAVPFVGSIVWLVQHREGIPVVGNLLWRYRNRRSAAHQDSPSGRPPADRGLVQ